MLTDNNCLDNFTTQTKASRIRRCCWPQATGRSAHCGQARKTTWCTTMTSGVGILGRAIIGLLDTTVTSYRAVFLLKSATTADEFDKALDMVLVLGGLGAFVPPDPKMKVWRAEQGHTALASKRLWKILRELVLFLRRPRGKAQFNYCSTQMRHFGAFLPTPRELHL
jgi:hypothetical protein